MTYLNIKIKIHTWGYYVWYKKNEVKIIKVTIFKCLSVKDLIDLWLIVYNNFEGIKKTQKKNTL
jgi:hypothetical protein